jgi:CheY-like chemotaxis protein
LVVEDDTSLRDLVARNLVARGHHVKEAANANEALDALRDGTPEVLVLDINLPDATGWDILRAADLGNETAVVVLTAVPISPKRLGEFRPLAYLPKPFPLEALVHLVDRAERRPLMSKAERPRRVAKLLVPFDGSEAAERVLRTACHASLEERVPLVVLCVVPIPAGRAAEETPSNLRMAVMQALVQAGEICHEEGAVATFRETYATNLANEIVRVADRMQAAVIALPLEHAAGVTELMSQTVWRVLAQAHCTVLLQPTSADALRTRAPAGSATVTNGVKGRG